MGNACQGSFNTKSLQGCVSSPFKRRSSVNSGDQTVAPVGERLEQEKFMAEKSKLKVSAPKRVDPFVNSVLGHRTPNIRDLYYMGKKLGQGQFGTTFLCTEISTGIEYACKSISKRKLQTKEDVDDVRREIQIMHHLSGHKNVVTIKEAYEDALNVHIVMELCGGGELFDRIIQRGHYSERKAAELTRIIVGVVEACHSLGVMHRDLKPENFLLVNENDDSSLKAIDFGLSVFFQPGMQQLQSTAPVFASRRRGIKTHQLALLTNTFFITFFFSKNSRDKFMNSPQH